MTLSSLKRTARVSGLHSGYFDRQCALERGISSSFTLNGVCRAAAAYQFGSRVRWRLRHIETMRNPSDEDSRFDAPKVRSLGIKCKDVRDLALGTSTTRPSMLRAIHEQLTKTENASTRNLPGDHHGSSSSASSPFKPDGGSSVSGSQLRPKGAFLEIFAGTARLTAAMRKRHLACCPGVDIQLGSHHGIRRRARQLAILSWIRAGWI